MSKKIVLYGANGQLGTEIRNRFTSKNVTAYSKKDLDVTDRSSLNESFSKVYDDIVINTSAYTNVDAAEDDFDLAKNINSDAVEYIAINSEKRQAHLFHYSTDYVFNGTKKSPYIEKDQTQPINLYGTSKLLGEEKIHEVMSKYYIFRTSWVYGSYGKNFAKTMLNLMMEKEEIRVVDDQVGVPTSTSMLAEITESFIDKIIDGNPPEYGIYNVVPDGEASWYDFSTHIFNYLKENFPDKCKTKIIQRVNSNEFKSRAKRPKNSVLSNSKLKLKTKIKLYNWQKYLNAFLDNYFKEEK